jgi:hypothetical protein
MSLRLPAYAALSLLSLMAPLAASAANDAGRPRAASNRPAVQTSLRGVYLDRQLGSDPVPWLLHYPQYRTRIRAALRDLAGTAHINLAVVFIGIPDTLRRPAQGNRIGEKMEQWANVSFLDNVAAFIDDCHQARVAVELDLADNRWIPHAVDSANHIGQPGKPWWPVAGDTPWLESAAWYSQVINYVEARARHPESIALWTMMGNYHLGMAEPVLWDTDGNPAIKSYTEKFVKHVWPAFRAAGARPKGSPILLPIFSNDPYWMAREDKRLSAFTNVKKWLVDDLTLPPDYWLMTAYPLCDPAPNGRYYFREILHILGPENASRIIATDLKGPGHEYELRDTILSAAGLRDPIAPGSARVYPEASAESVPAANVGATLACPFFSLRAGSEEFEWVVAQCRGASPALRDSNGRCAPLVCRAGLSIPSGVEGPSPAASAVSFTPSEACPEGTRRVEGAAPAIISATGSSGADLLRWHFRKCAEYGFAGWWIWAYQDTRDHQWGIRTLDGRWKPALLQAIMWHPDPSG